MGSESESGSGSGWVSGLESGSEWVLASGSGWGGRGGRGRDGGEGEDADAVVAEVGVPDVAVGAGRDVVGGRTLADVGAAGDGVLGDHAGGGDLADVAPPCSAKNRSPLGPTVIPVGLELLVGTVYSVTAPAVVIVAILP